MSRRIRLMRLLIFKDFNIRIILQFNNEKRAVIFLDSFCKTFMDIECMYF